MEFLKKNMVPFLLLLSVLLLGILAYQQQELQKSIYYSNRQMDDLLQEVRSQEPYLDDIKYGVLGVRDAVNNLR